jgi:hypothetical protein
LMVAIPTIPGMPFMLVQQPTIPFQPNMSLLCLGPLSLDIGHF